MRLHLIPLMLAIPSLAAASPCDIVQIEAGGTAAYAVLEDGTLWSWGWNVLGDVGPGTTGPVGADVLEPQRFPLYDVTAVSSGYAELAIAQGGGVYVWGPNTHGEHATGATSPPTMAFPLPELLPFPHPAISVGAGRFGSCLAVLNDGTVLGWGLNTDGELGLPPNTQANVPGFVLGATQMRAVAVGDNHVLALDDQGRVWAWGGNDEGQLGDGTTTRRPSPLRIPGLQNVVAISAGMRASVALDSTGAVWTWGRNAQGQLGRSGNGLVPATVPGVVARAVDMHVETLEVALLGDGAVWSWGENSWGQLGGGWGGPGQYSTTPVEAIGLRDVTMVAADGYRELAANASTVVAWGENSHGYLGNGGRIDSNVPVITTPAWQRTPPSQGNILLAARVGPMVDLYFPGAVGLVYRLTRDLAKGSIGSTPLAELVAPTGSYLDAQPDPGPVQFYNVGEPSCSGFVQ